MKTGWQVIKKVKQDEILDVCACKDFENQNKEF